MLTLELLWMTFFCVKLLAAKASSERAILEQQRNEAVERLKLTSSFTQAQLASDKQLLKLEEKLAQTEIAAERRLLEAQRQEVIARQDVRYLFDCVMCWFVLATCKLH